MVAWIFKSNTPLDGFLRVGFGGSVLVLLGKNAVGQINTTPGTVSLICLLSAFLLAFPAINSKTQPADESVRRPVLVLSVAYAWMALLYFFKWIGWARVPATYDAFTDVLGTLFFIVAWFMLLPLETDEQSHSAEAAALTVLTFLTVAAGFSKAFVEMPAQFGQTDEVAVRLALNICNAAVFFSLYGLMRRLLPSPDPVTHVLLVLYGCAQIAAPARDCLTAVSGTVSALPCTFPSFPRFLGAAVEWILLLGKVAFAVYLSYLYFNGKIRSRGVAIWTESGSHF